MLYILAPLTEIDGDIAPKSPTVLAFRPCEPELTPISEFPYRYWVKDYRCYNRWDCPSRDRFFLLALCYHIFPPYSETRFLKETGFLGHRQLPKSFITAISEWK